MGMDTILMEQAKRHAQLQDQEKSEARLVVAGHSQSVEDCAMLLRALGLMIDDA